MSIRTYNHNGNCIESPGVIPIAPVKSAEKNISYFRYACYNCNFHKMGGVKIKSRKYNFEIDIEYLCLNIEMKISMYGKNIYRPKCMLSLITLH